MGKKNVPIATVRGNSVETIDLPADVIARLDAHRRASWTMEMQAIVDYCAKNDIGAQPCHDELVKLGFSYTKCATAKRLSDAKTALGIE